MKTLFVACFTLLTAGSVFAQDAPTKNYCVYDSEGKAVVMDNVELITAPVDLALNAKLYPNGVVVWGDSTTTALKGGDCIDATGIIYSSNQQRDFRDVNALNHIHLLPEVQVSADRIRSEAELRNAYLRKAYLELEENDYEIRKIKTLLGLKEGKDEKKLLRMVKSLEAENQELKIDFDNYVHYGKGQVLVFINEFEADIRPLKTGLRALEAGMM